MVVEVTRLNNNNPYKRVKIDGQHKYVHRLVMEEHLGRKLNRNEYVHHIDGNPHNNDIDNLEIISPTEHMRHHRLNASEEVKKKYSTMQMGEKNHRYGVVPSEETRRKLSEAKKAYYRRLKEE